MFHREWDNMNKLTTNTHGSNVVNSTGGIMIQEVNPGYDSTTQPRRHLPLYKRTNTRSLKLETPEILAPVHIYGRVGPKFLEGADFSPPTANNEVYAKCLQEYRVWSLVRVLGSSGDKQLVPAFGVFISATGIRRVLHHQGPAEAVRGSNDGSGSRVCAQHI